MSTVCAAVTVHSNFMKSLSYSRFSVKNFYNEMPYGGAHKIRIGIVNTILCNHISNNGNKLSVKYQKKKWENNLKK